MNDFSFVLI